MEILTPSDNVESDCEFLLGWSFEVEPSNDNAPGNHPAETGEEEIEENHTERTADSRHLCPIDPDDESYRGEK